jgi:hypothetical protein
MAITKYKIQNSKIYKALLTQTGELSGTDISSLNWSFIVGERYTITNYVLGDDFSNIANVISATAINGTGCEFIATGKAPTDWSNGSTITSNGGLVVNELENNLGFPLGWYEGGGINSPFGPGVYGAFHDVFGPLNNLFPSEKTHITVQSKFGYSYPFLSVVSVIASVNTFGIVIEPDPLMNIDDYISLIVFDPYDGTPVHNQLDHVSICIEIYP